MDDTALDDQGRPVHLQPRYRNVYVYNEKRAIGAPLAPHVGEPLHQLYDHYADETFPRYAEKGRTPVLILIANTIDNATALYRYIAGYKDGPIWKPGHLPLLSNVDPATGSPRPRRDLPTLLVHSRVDDPADDSGSAVAQPIAEQAQLFTPDAKTAEEKRQAVRDVFMTVGQSGEPGQAMALVHGSRPLGEPRSTSWPSWRQQVHDLDMKSRVHPKYKTKYHVGNWPAYDRALVQRGDITVWLAPDAIATWEAVGVGKRGGQRQYSDLAIETALTLRLIFHLPLRQTEGFLTSIFGMLGLELSTPDHTTLSRRGQHLDLTLRRAPAGAGLHLMVDSTGLSIVGEGEWAAAKHGGRGRRGWKKRHLGVDRSGVIVARALTEASVDDATTGITLIEAVDGALGRVTADTAYDTVGFYEAAGARGATVVVPPTSTANVSRRGPRSRARDRTILAVKERGRQRWKKMSGYHGQARVENAFFRYKSIIGDSLRACSPAGRGTEVDLACNILNQMTGLGRPMSYRIGR